jgi:hypothetical protein
MIPILAKKNPFIHREKHEHLKEQNTKNTLNYIGLRPKFDPPLFGMPFGTSRRADKVDL